MVYTDKIVYQCSEVIIKRLTAQRDALLDACKDALNGIFLGDYQDIEQIARRLAEAVKKVEGE